MAGARAAQSLRAALDTTGRTLFAVDAAGAVLWATPQASQVLAACAPRADDAYGLPPAGRAWLRGCLAGGRREPSPSPTCPARPIR